MRERAGGAVEDAASAAQDKAMELRSKGASQLRDQLDTRTTDVGRQAKTVAQALRQSGQNLRGEGKCRPRASRTLRPSAWSSLASTSSASRATSCCATRSVSRVGGRGCLRG